MVKRSFIHLILLHCLLPLLAGALVYLFFRLPDFFIQFFQIKLHIDVKNAVLRQLFFVIPDFCWSYSLACALYLFAIGYSLNFKTSTLLISILVIGAEVVQLGVPNYFTFDILDLLAAVITLFLSTFQMKRIAYEKEP